MQNKIFMRTINIHLIKDFLDKTLQEDINHGDITSNFVIPNNINVNFNITSRENIIISGVPILEYFIKTYSNIKYKIHTSDGQEIKSESVILSGSGNAKEILLLERIMLNYIQHLSSIATYTQKFVSQISENSKAKIYDTRKTTPGLRMLEKYAVTCGGGYNHRMSLSDSIMIKDNHIAACDGSIKKAISLAKHNKSHYMTIEVECDTLQQVQDAISEGVDIIMLDNMSIHDITKAIKIINGKAQIEVSGGVTLDKINAISQTGVDIISTGKITQSAPIVDIGLDII